MSPWVWQALAKLYQAGADGLCNDYTEDRADRAPSWDTLLHLSARRDGAYMEEYRYTVNEPRPASWILPTQARVRITERGRYHYELHFHCYRDLYPDIDVAAPTTLPDQAHRGLAQHQAKPAAHLVRESDFRVLVRLSALETADECYLRSMFAQDHQLHGEPIPDAIKAIAPGLLPWEIKQVAKTARAVDRLTGYPGGALVAIMDIPNRRRNSDGPATLPLVCLTPTGREHYARHLVEYQQVYPDVPTTASASPNDPRPGS